MENITKCLLELQTIKKYLVKKGQSRYKGNVIANKLSESEAIFKRGQEYIQVLSIEYESKQKELNEINLIWNNIKEAYSYILILCKTAREPSSDSEFSDSSSYPNTEMEFDLKTACSLIPVMNTKEESVKGIIDSVEMYSEMLKPEGNTLLIKFVLKSRLSENAKLRMSAMYSSVSDLVKDMRKILLTKKSFVAIQSRLQSATQGWRTIDEFGTEIENLFTDLTISQADGDKQTYSVLKTINEKIAVKRFSDGLRDSRLSTIIAARNYEQLKDAIQAAKDEEMTTASTSNAEGVMFYNSRRGRGKYPFQNNSSRGFRGRGRGYNDMANRDSQDYNQDQYAPNRGNGRGRWPRAMPPQRGYSGYNSSFRGRRPFRGENRQQGVFYAEQPAEQQPETEVRDEDNINETNNLQFFRS